MLGCIQNEVVCVQNEVIVLFLIIEIKVDCHKNRGIAKTPITVVKIKCN